MHSSFIPLIHFHFGRRDLDQEAEEYIVGWARELPAKRPFKIIIHFPDDEHQIKAARELREAFARYFTGRAAVIQGDLNELFRIGRRSLAIGVPILIVCLFSAHLTAGYLAEAPFKRMVEESFLILGWVANWRPLEMFLYDWWPIALRRDLYRRLSAATVEVTAVFGGGIQGSNLTTMAGGGVNVKPQDQFAPAAIHRRVFPASMTRISVHRRPMRALGSY